jgi:DNA polymerase I
MKIGFFDLEANGLLPTVNRMHCAVVKTKGTGEVRKFWPRPGNDYVKQLLEYLDSFDVLVAHNGIGYDFPLLQKLYGWKFKGKIVDTLIMSRLLNPKRMVPFHCPDKKLGPHSLGAWGYRVGRGKPEHDDWENYSPEMLHRCTEDVEILELVFNELMLEAKDGDWKSAIGLSHELFTHLQRQEEYGWLVDQEHMHKCIAQLNRWIAKIDAVLIPRLPSVVEVLENKLKGEYNYIKKPFLKSGAYSKTSLEYCANNNLDPDSRPILGCFSRISFRKVDLNSNMETKDYLLSLGWEPLEWNTNDDGERTSPKLSKDDPFEGLNDRAGKLVAKRVQCRQRLGIIEGLLKIIRPDGRIASVVNTLAVTGRATHRGIVNIPKPSSFYGKQMRAIFTSRVGYTLVGTDSAGNQLRMLAGRMNNPVYTKALVEGKKEDGSDNHSMTRDIGELESRDVAKNVMYCLLFGGGDVKLAKTARKPPGSGPQLRDRLYRGLDGLGDLVERITKEWKETARQKYNAKFGRMEYFNGRITGLDGRPIVVASEHQLLVYLLQSDEAVHMSKAYCLLNERLAERFTWGVDYGVVCFYHDEYTIECREEIAQEVKEISEQCIVDAGKFFNIACPHAGGGNIGKTWYAIH